MNTAFGFAGGSRRGAAEGRLPRAFVMAAAVAGGMLAAAPARAATVIGPGLVSTTGADTAGERLNIDAASQTLAAGTYDLADFSYASTGDGNVVPFLATGGESNQYQLLWIGSAVAGTNGSTATANPIGHFTLPAATPVFAGFYTAGGRVAFIESGNTDHAGTVAVPRGGVTIGGFSNPDLARTYAFSVAVDPSQQVYVGPGFLSNGGADTGSRLNVDQANSRLFAAGTYDVSDFSFHGTLVPMDPNPTGNVTPFLARLTADNTYETVWVGGAVPSAAGGVTVDPEGGFTLPNPETLYAGFFTDGNAAVAFTEGPGRPPGFGITDHDNLFVPPTGPGSVIEAFAFNDLARQYSFSLGTTLVPEPATAALALTGGGLLLLRRSPRRGR